jgi:outer membrane biosynthesis protein TonB
MSPDRDPGRLDNDTREIEEYEDEDEAPRSIFSALWFRGLLAVLILGVLAAVAVPYMLDFATTPALKSPPEKTATASAPAPAPAPQVPTAAPAAPVTAAPVAPAPAAPRPEPAVSAPAQVKPEPPPTRSEPAAARPVQATPVKRSAVTAKAAEPQKASAKAVVTSKGPATAEGAAAPTSGPYWVQVGAFKDPETALRLAARLREQGVRAETSTTASTGAASARPAPAAAASGDRYDVVVSGADVDAKLASKGLTGEATTAGTVLKPSLPLREAVALSRDLADSGLSVQVRRVSAPAPAAAAAPPATTAETLHRVRVGGFPDRTSAAAAQKQLEEKGYKTFIARGTE